MLRPRYIELSNVQEGGLYGLTWAHVGTGLGFSSIKGV